MIWIWIIGAMFTDGLCDPKNEQGFWRGCKRLLEWPWELGQWIYNYTHQLR